MMLLDRDRQAVERAKRLFQRIEICGSFKRTLG